VKLLDEELVLARQLEGLREEVEEQVIPTLILLAERVVLLLQLLAVALDVLHHQIFSRELVVVRKVVDQLPVGQACSRIWLEQRAYAPDRRSIDVPVLFLLDTLLPAALLERALDNFLVEVGLPLQLAPDHLTNQLIN